MDKDLDYKLKGLCDELELLNARLLAAHDKEVIEAISSEIAVVEESIDAIYHSVNVADVNYVGENHEGLF